VWLSNWDRGTLKDHIKAGDIKNFTYDRLSGAKIFPEIPLLICLTFLILSRVPLEIITAILTVLFFLFEGWHF